jgi:DNA-binding response OmpR family regulator
LDKQKLATASVVIYDPIRGNMLLTRSVIHGLGFRRIDGMTCQNELTRKLKDADISLLIIEATDQKDAVVKMIRAQRLGELGANPFIPMIATLWSGSTDHVADLMNVGCDDVLLRPFSSTQALERVRALLVARKQFVVTSDYVGPDRGLSSRNQMTPRTFVPPNFLRDRLVLPQYDTVEQQKRLSEARVQADQDRVAKLARRIAMAAEVVLQSQGRGDPNSGFVMDLLESASELERVAKRLAIEQVQDIASVLSQISGLTSTPDGEQLENANLTRQLALALFVAYGVEGGEAFRPELGKTWVKVQERLGITTEKKKKRHAFPLSMAS